MPVSVVFGGIQRDGFIFVSHILDSFIRRWSMLQGHACFFLEDLEPRTPRVCKNATMIHPMGIFNIPIHHPNPGMLLDVVGDFPNGWILFKRDTAHALTVISEWLDPLDPRDKRGIRPTSVQQKK